MRKRVHALRRAPDGSAFQRCDVCGVSVPVALLDMHEYECDGKISKRSRGDSKESAVCDQPRSPFCCFMESYMKNCKDREWIEIGRLAFETWASMAPKEKQPFVKRAEQVNSAYLRTLLKETKTFSGVEDEADSSMVGKFDPDYGEPSDYDEYHLQRGHNISFESFDLTDSWTSWERNREMWNIQQRNV